MYGMQIKVPTTLKYTSFYKTLNFNDLLSLLVLIHRLVRKSTKRWQHGTDNQLLKTRIPHFTAWITLTFLH